MIKLLDWLLNYCNYTVVSTEEYEMDEDEVLAEETLEDLLQMYDEVLATNRALNGTLGKYQLRHEDDNVLISALVSLQGLEEVTLTADLIDEINNQQLVTSWKLNNDRSVTCIVKTAQEVLNHANPKQQ